MQLRQIILDTETTGLSVQEGHRVIEIAAVELINRRITNNHFHHYINTDRTIDPAAFAIHGISSEFLADKPFFQDIVDEFLNFVSGAELIIHNAPFDVGFINNELLLAKKKIAITELCQVIDTLQLARKKHPGQQNNLDALCKRYSVDNSSRALHGALLDAHLLASVYLAMTGGQISLFGEIGFETLKSDVKIIEQNLTQKLANLKVIFADAEELSAHQKRLEVIQQTSHVCLWQEE